MPDTRKKKSGWKRRLGKWLLIPFLLLIVLIFAALVFFKVQGFKQALADLVDSSTNGAYVLNIGHTDINYTELDFRLDDVSIQKTAAAEPGGVSMVSVPFIEVNFGSFLSLLSGGPLKLETFIIAEPFVEINPGNKKDEEKRPVNLAHEIAGFYPAVKAVLDRFNIQEFRINRAGIDIQEPENDIEVKLIDLLVREWNMRELSDDAQFRLEIGGQPISLHRTAFSFSDIVFDYQDGALRIEDYSFTQKDSLDRTVISLEGASVIIDDLEYEAIMNEEYVFQGLTINNPVVTANIFPHEEKLKEEKSRQPVSDLLKKNLGELLIRDGAINDAELHLNIYNEYDTLQLDLPKMTLKTQNFVVTEDSSTLMIEKLKLDISGTTLDLGNGIGIAFDQLSYNEKYDLKITGLSLTDTDNDRELIRSSEVDLFNFSIFNYIYTEDLVADSVIMQEGVITVFEKPADAVSSPREKKKERSNTRLHVGKVSFDNIRIDYDLEQRMASIRDIELVAENVISEDAFVYTLRYMKTPRVIIRDKREGVNADIYDILFEPRLFTINRLTAAYGEANLDLNGFRAKPENFNIYEPLSHAWNSIFIDDIKVKGTLPKGNNEKKAGQKTRKEKEPFRLDSVAVRKMEFDIFLSAGQHFYTRDSRLLVANLVVGDGFPAFDEFHLSIDSVGFRSDSTRITLGESEINNLNGSTLNHLVISTPNSDSINVRHIQVGKLHPGENLWGIESLLLKNIELDQQNHHINTIIDSLSLENISVEMGGLPHVDKIGVYGPNTRITSQQTTSSNQKRTRNKTEKKPTPVLSLFNELTVSPGEIALNNNIIRFEGIDIAHNPEGKRLSVNISGVELGTRSSKFRIQGIRTNEEDLLITGLNIDAREEYVEAMKTENDVISGQFKNIAFKNVNWDSLSTNNTFLAERVVIDDFNIRIRRDKTLPDPDPVTKPHLIRGMIPESEAFSVQAVEIRNGQLTYFEVGEKTGMEGHIRLNDLNATVMLQKKIEEAEEVLTGSARLYNDGSLDFRYSRLEGQRFDLQIRLTDMHLDSLNQMIDPLESIRIPSGFLREYDLSVQGDSLNAAGTALITYEDLHIEIFKRHEPDVRNFGSRLLTLLADGVILKHNKTDAVATFEQERITFKGPINYWVKCAVHGVMASIRKGKDNPQMND